MVAGVPFDDFASATADLGAEAFHQSLFDLSEFLEVIPLSYGRLLEEWTSSFDLSFPINWMDLCVPDFEWLSSAAEAVFGSAEALLAVSDTPFDSVADALIGLGDAVDVGSSGFFDLAGEIFSNISDTVSEIL